MMRFILVTCLVFASGCYGNDKSLNLMDMDPYIISGEPASPGEFPSQLSLQWLGEHNGGASVISADWALTAAHCVVDFPLSSLRLLAGTNNLDQPGTYHYIERVVFHPAYDFSNSLVNDIAVVKVSVPFNLNNPLIKPIALPTQGQTTADGSVATVIGWGRLSQGGPIPKQLQKVDIAIVNADICHNIYEDAGNTTFPTQICADLPQGNVGSCNGDSGGPLFVNKVVVGLVSWARGCANKGYPTVYTRVSSYRLWIKDNTGV